MSELALNYIVFYDGDCGFCNSTVQFILAHENKDEIQFSALQTDFTVDFLKSNNFLEPDFSTLYFWSDGKLLNKSAAVLEISKHLKSPYSWFRFLKIFPRFLRDGVYGFIAKHRKKIKNNACYLPSEIEKRRFLNSISETKETIK